MRGLARPRARGWAGAWAAAVILAAAPPAYGQGQTPPAGSPQVPAGASSRPQQAWFGNGVGNLAQSLTGVLSISGGRVEREIFDVSFAELPNRSDVRSLAGGLTYSLSGRRASLSAGANSYATFYPALTDEVLASHAVQVSGSLQLSTRTTLGAGQDLYYEPALARSIRGIFDPQVGTALPPELDVGAIEERALSYGTTVNLSHALSTRSNLSLDYAQRRTDFGSDVAVQRYDSAGARYMQQLTESLGFRLGYRYGTSRVADDAEAPRNDQHQIDVGIDVDKALSISRRTTVGFGTGTTLVRSDSRTQAFLTGRVRLDHQVARTWSTGVNYARDVRFLEGVTEIALTDQVGATLSGSVSRRVGLDSSVSYYRGQVGLGDAGNPYSAVTGRAGMSVAASGRIGVSWNYSYLRSRFDQADFLLLPNVRFFERHSTSLSVGLGGVVAFGVTYSDYQYVISRDRSVTASVTLFAPIYARTRRPDASR